MTVCANRTDSPGFFTPRTAATGKASCPCGDEVAADVINDSTTHLDTQENR